MSSNNHALIRYRTIDRCLKSRDHNYFLKDLIEECSEAVHEYEEYRTGKQKEFKLVSRRSIMYDLKFMKNEEFGFGAPIEHDNIDGYYYSDPYFEVFQAKISKSDLDKLSEALLLLKEVSGEAHFKDLESTITKLEETYRINRSTREKSIIQFENSTNAEGQKWVSEVKSYIEKNTAITILYQPFGSDSYQRSISPYLLKEYNNRWFCIGYDHEVQKITNLGLDRIVKLSKSLKSYVLFSSFDRETYLENIIGVSMDEDAKVEKVEIKAYGLRSHYLQTKPLHKTQKLVESNEDFSIFQLSIIPNYELESKLLSNADSIEVLSPQFLRERIKKRLEKGILYY